LRKMPLSVYGPVKSRIETAVAGDCRIIFFVRAQAALSKWRSRASIFLPHS
jgi:hypothetical protein